MPSLMAAGDALVRATLAVALAAAFLYASYGTSVVLVGPRRTLLRLTGTLAAWLILASALFHVLVPLGAFRLLPAMSAVVAVALTVALAARHLIATAWRWDRVFVRRVSARLGRSPARFVALGFVVLAWSGLVRALFLPPAGWDALTYHVVKPVMWLQSGGLSFLSGPGPWNYYAHFPAGGEVLMAWAMLPVGADTFVTLVDVVAWVGLGVVLVALGRELGVREPFGSTAAAVVLAIPTVRLLVGAAYVEIALLASIAAGLALGLAAFRGRRLALVLALGVLGVAGAIKAPAVVLGGAVALALALRAVRPLGIGVTSVAIVVYLAGALPWMAWATAHTGAPLSPVPLRVASIPLGIAPPELVWYMNRPQLADSSLLDEARTVRQLFQLPAPGVQGLGATLIIPGLLFLPGLVRLFRRHRFAALLVSLVVLVNLASYYSDGFLVVRRIWSVSSARFLLPVAALAVLVGAVGLTARSRRSAVYLTYLRMAALVTLASSAIAYLSWLSAGLVVLGTAVAVAAAWLARSAGNRRRQMMVAGALAVLATAGVEAVRDVLRPRLLLETVLHEVPRYWVEAATALDDPGRPLTIAMTSGPWQNIDNWFAAPFAGRRLQNRLVHVPVARDGHVRHFGDEAVRAEYDRTADRDGWTTRLGTYGVTHVMSFAPRSMELDWMEQNPARFRREHGRRGEWGLFSVLPEPAR